MSTFDESIAQNPLLGDWKKFEHEFPPFQDIKPIHYEPALKYSMEQHLNDIKAIVENTDAASFDNTIVALDKSGHLFDRVRDTFENLCSSLGTPEYQEIELKMAAPMAEHYNKVATFPGLFAKVDTVYQQRDTLTPLQRRLVERYHLDFVRAGAKFSPDIQAKYGEIVKELAQLTTQFTQNVVADEAEVYLELKTDEDKAGLPADLIDAARQAAIDRKLAKEGDDLGIITLSRSLVEPFLVYSARRDLREKAWRLWTSRGELNASRNNYPLIQRILALRQQKATYHGYTNFAEYALADTMAGKPDKVLELLQEVWSKAKGSIAKERSELESFLRTTTTTSVEDTTIEPWDWRYYAEKVRIQNYTLDASEIKPYFTLSNMLSSLFHTANSLFGLEFVERSDLPKYHPSIKIYEVYRPADEGVKELVGLFISDNYARAYKHSGAWMSNYRGQSYDLTTNQRIIPIVVNNNNFNPPVYQASIGREESFVGVDDTITLFHEFGHGLHGLLSDVTYSRLSGTNVLRDFVELPSQLFEHWALEQAQLSVHAKHFEHSDQVIPIALIEKLKKARKFNQGFQTIEYTASALVDILLHMKTHSLEPSEALDLPAFEQSILQELGMPKGVVMRHRLPHFQHLFSGDSYASAYYVYLWAEVLDADGYEAFTETGDIFHPDVAERVRRYIYSAGNSQDPAELYRLFRGRDPIIEPMLRKKGLI